MTLMQLSQLSCIAFIFFIILSSEDISSVLSTCGHRDGDPSDRAPTLRRQRPSCIKSVLRSDHHSLADGAQLPLKLGQHARFEINRDALLHRIVQERKQQRDNCLLYEIRSTSLAAM